MAKVKAFSCIRPEASVAAKVAALPYDVYDRKEAKAAVEGQPLSFLNIDRPETQYGEDFDMYSQKAYETARDMLAAEIADGTFIVDPDEAYYLYELMMNGRVQTGIVALCSIEDYKNDVIKKHENTLAAKEEDRINHIRYCGYQTGPIFLAYRRNNRLTQIIMETKYSDPLYAFIGKDRVGHRVWKIDRIYNDDIEKSFEGIGEIYIADGHHRAASAVKVGASDDGFLSVLFAEDDLKILPYNRALKDLNGMTEKAFLGKLEELFEIEKSDESVMPGKKGEVGMFIAGRGEESQEKGWYRLTVKPQYASIDPVGGLDVSILQNNVLGPMLGIDDPKTNSRISFIGGIRGNEELERLVNECGYAVAFSMYPTTIDDLMSIADSKKIMPPKSTWFEPKLRSGLFVHTV